MVNYVKNMVFKDIPLSRYRTRSTTYSCQVFRGSDSTPYQGARKAEAIVSYMIKQSLPAVSIVTPAKFESFSTSDKVVVIGFFGADDTASNQTFAAVANAQRDDFLFGASNDAALAKEQGVSMPGVALYKTYDEGKTVYDGKFDQNALMGWTKQASVPLMGEVGPDTYAGYMESGLPLAYVFVESEADKKKFGDALAPVAKKYRGKINFATIDAVQFGGHASNLNLYILLPMRCLL